VKVRILLRQLKNYPQISKKTKIMSIISELLFIIEYTNAPGGDQRSLAGREQGPKGIALA